MVIMLTKTIFLLLGCEIELANRGAFRVHQLDFG